MHNVDLKDIHQNMLAYRQQPVLSTLLSIIEKVDLIIITMKIFGMMWKNKTF